MQPKIKDSTVVWFTVLEAAKTKNDEKQIEFAEKKLLALGIKIEYLASKRGSNGK